MKSNTNHLPRYRTIKECIGELQALDKNTAISEFYIRRLCKNNLIKYLPNGSKSLVNLGSLLEYLGYRAQDDTVQAIQCESVVNKETSL